VRRGVRNMGLFIAFAIVGFLALASFIRLAPADPAAWNQLPDLYTWGTDGPYDAVIPMTGAASLRLSPSKGDPAELLSRLAVIAAETPRTTLVAGSPDDGRMTWETRSLIWGFPDYTTAEIRPDGLYIYARLRFGRSDMGINAARLTDWLSRL
jgi:Protein of unknown function (DUF1499)